MKKTTLFALATLLMLAGFGCKKPAPVLPKTPAQIEDEKFLTLPNYFLIDSQVAGQSVKLREVKFDKPGFVVVRELKDNEPGTTLGFSAIVPQGSVQNVKVAVTLKLDPTKSYIAELHDDTDGDTKFNIKKDLPLYNPENGEAIRKTFTVGQ